MNIEEEIAAIHQKLDQIIRHLIVNAPRCRVCGQTYEALQHGVQFPSSFPVEQIHQFAP